MANFVTVEGVELARVGTWAASTGPTALTAEMFESIVDAFNSGNFNLPVIKIGHLDPRFENPDWDGDPAYGQIANVRFSDARGGTLIGDYVNVPEELAEKLESAYPHRSAEIDFDLELLDENGEVTDSYPAVLSGLALLGSARPAVDGLAAVHAKFTAKLTGSTLRSKSTVRVNARASFASAASAHLAFNGNHTANSLRTALHQAVGALSTPDSYVDTWVEDYDDSSVWHFYGDGMVQRSYSVAADGSVTLSPDFIRVVEKRVFEPAPDTAPVPHSLSRALHSAGKAALAAPANDEGGAEMAFTEPQLVVLRKQFGLAETATQEEVLAALDAAAAEKPAEPTVEPAAEPVVEPAKVEPAAEPAKPAEPAAQEPTPTIQLSAANFAAMQEENARFAAAFAKMDAERAAERRDKAIFSAMQTGRLHPSEKDAWREALDRDEEGVTALLSARHPAFPTQELGSDSAQFALDTSDTIKAARLAADDEFFGGSK